MRRDNLLIVSDSERDANMLYAVGMFVPDPFIYLRLQGKCHIVMNDLEIDRARKNAPHCRVLSLSSLLKAMRRDGLKQSSFAHIIAYLLRRNRLKKIFVPPSFPYGLARQVRRLGVRLKVKEEGIFPQRELKNADEVKKISAALVMAEVGLSEGMQALKSSKIGKGGKLMYQHMPLTAEKLRSVIDIAVMQAGGIASHTIVACGRQGCDPHEAGRGPLRAHQPIVIDVFPRSQKTGYFGDITRTMVRGRASEGVRRLYHTVARGQEVAFERITSGVKAVDVHQSVRDFFNNAGYKTQRRNGRMEGFFHGTGHGLGLELHEAPRVGASSPDVLRAGHVVTVEPGLYYPELGGVRLEDVALVTSNGPRNLTKFEKLLEV